MWSPALPPIDLSVVLLLACLFVFLRRRLNNVRTPYPPGPPPYPIIGNLFDFPLVQPWITYAKWQKKYGGIVYCNALGQEVIIINSLKVVNELFEKRSHMYSDRPLLPMRDVLGWDFVLGLMHYGDTWKHHRRVLNQKYKPDAVLAYRPTQVKKIHELLRSLLVDPAEFDNHYKLMAASITMVTVYGYDISSHDDPFLVNADTAIRLMADSMFPGASIVNALPFLRYFPSWFPGSQFHKSAEKCRTLTTEMMDLPYDFVKKNLASGTATSCLISELIEENETVGGSTEGEQMIKGLGATAFAAGVDTVTSAMGSIFLAVVTHPEARKKAQEEIDRVVGRDRLPTFDDRPNLPYLEAMYRELMRWRPATPLGVAHTATVDDVYEGYFIPKGATILSNIWAMTRDESKYFEPDRFNPDRFFTPDGQLNDDSTVLTFGFGRRICVGRYAADATIWATMASVLSVFNFDFARDVDGNVIPIDGKYTDGLVSHVNPFRCSISPRDETARRLIEETA